MSLTYIKTEIAMKKVRDLVGEATEVITDTLRSFEPIDNPATQKIADEFTKIKEKLELIWLRADNNLSQCHADNEE